MPNILLHGLGQNASSWDKTRELLSFDAFCPDLFGMVGDNVTYNDLFSAFSECISDCCEPLNICGLSLGGILALDYAGRFPEKVNSVVLIGVPHEIPKLLFAFQNLVFSCMPKKIFESMGTSKSNVISLCRSMKSLDIRGMAEKVRCRSLILCGENDKANSASVYQLHEWIKDSAFDFVKSSGHEVNCHNPAALARVLNDFWRE